MVQIILIRPGSTDYDLQSRIQGTLEMPLCESGQKEANKVVEALRAYLPKAIYSSPSKSAEETAGIIGQALKLKPKTLEPLQNINLGLWQGLLVDEVRRKQSKVYKQWQEHPETVHPPDGETLAEVVARVEQALEKLARKHKNGVLALVVPEPLASIIRQCIDGKELGDLWKVANGCGRIDVLQLEPGFSTAEPVPAPAANANSGTSTNGAATQNVDASQNGVNGKSLDPSAIQPPPAGKARIVYRGVVVEGR